MQLLSLFHSRALIPLATVSHRFHALVLRILHYRLLVATSLKDYKIILECFHPAFRLTEPHIFCKYLGTEGLSLRHEGEGSLYENVEPAHQLGKLASLYSIFRPETTVEERANGSLLVPAAGRDILFCARTRGDTGNQNKKHKADNTAGETKKTKSTPTS